MFQKELLAIFSFLFIASAQDANFWNTMAQNTLKRALDWRPNYNIAKNVIFFLGDGMEATTIKASRIYRGQLAGRTGEEEVLVWEQFPSVAQTKTYATNRQITDSAQAASSLFLGVKTKYGTVGVDDTIQRGDCNTIAGNEVDSVLVQANQKGKSTGFITTARVTHASPASLYAHAADRNWEKDSDIPADQRDIPECKGIARQLVEDNSFINVILGGGRRMFLPNSVLDPEYGADGVTGAREDGRNLTDDWLTGKNNANYVWNKAMFDDIDQMNTDYLLGT